MQTKESDQTWFRDSGALRDPFHPLFVHGALQDAPWMKPVVFGLCTPLPDGPEDNNMIIDLFAKYGKP
jgi:hypothetical protein